MQKKFGKNSQLYSHSLLLIKQHKLDFLLEILSTSKEISFAEVSRLTGTNKY